MKCVNYKNMYTGIKYFFLMNLNSVHVLSSKFDLQNCFVISFPLNIYNLEILLIESNHGYAKGLCAVCKCLYID